MLNSGKLAVGSLLLAAALISAGCRPITPAPASAPSPDTGASAPAATAAPVEEPAPSDAAAAQPVDFTRLVQGESFTAEVAEPTLFLISDAGALDSLGAQLGEPEQAAQAQQLATDASLGIAVFAGMMGSSGHGITVQSVSAAGGELAVVAELTGPGPDQMASDVITFPYDVVQVQRADLPVDPPTAWKLYDTDGNLLAEGSS